MAKKSDPTNRRRLTPRDALRRFFEPQPTRRQILRGFVVGAASIGCSSTDESTREEPPVGGAGSAPPIQNEPTLPAAPAASGASSDVQPSPAIPEAVATSPAPEPAVPAAEPTPQPTPEPADVEQPAAPSPGEQAELPDPDQPPVLEPDEPAVAIATARSAYDMVQLGRTGIITSRLAMGSGTTGYDGSSAQTRMGADFTDLLVQGYERGIRFFETADAYGSHSRVRDAMQQVGRQNVTLLTKTMAESRRDAEADLDRFMEELGTDYLDIVLLHIRTSPNWVTESEGAMQALAEAKAAGRIRAHGVSCHSLEALRLAAATEWVEIDLARINPYGMHMDADPDTVKAVLDEMKLAGKGVIGMKILGQGDAVDRFDEAIEHATRLECIDAFTIGFRSTEELDQVASRIASTVMG